MEFCHLLVDLLVEDDLGHLVPRRRVLRVQCELHPHLQPLQPGRVLGRTHAKRRCVAPRVEEAIGAVRSKRTDKT